MSKKFGISGIKQETIQVLRKAKLMLQIKKNDPKKITYNNIIYNAVKKLIGEK